MNPFVLALFQKEQFVFFREPYSLNIFAIRCKNRAPDCYDDSLGYVFYDEKGNYHCHQFPCTVDAGKPWLINPMDPNGGTAGIVEGQYRGLWELGKFKGTEALIQRTPVKIYRDNNRNEILDYDPAKTTTGLYGIFLHDHFQQKHIADVVGTSSAGCVVTKRRVDLWSLISACKLQIDAGLGNFFTFTLFSEEQVDKVYKIYKI